MRFNSSLFVCCVSVLFTGCFSSEMTSHNSVSRTKVPEFVHSETQVHENCVSLKMSKALPFTVLKAEEGTELYHVYFDYVQFEGNTESIQKLNKIIRDLVFDGQPSSADYLKNFLFENQIEELQRNIEAEVSRVVAQDPRITVSNGCLQ